jgi:hypothetical protein
MSLLEVDAVIRSYNEKYMNSWEQVRLIRNTIGACMGAKLTPMKFSWDTDDIPENKTYTIEERIQAEQSMLNWLNNL